MYQLLQRILRLYAVAVLRLYAPTVVGITGSVGKTSTKAAIATVLGVRFRVRQNTKNYNNELGLPLTVLGAESPGRSLLGWARVFLRASWLLLMRSSVYPEVLVLEYGADHPGDIRYLTDFVPCDVGVLTAISPAHTEFFGNIDEVFREKRILIDRVKPGGTAILNADDERIAALASQEQSRVVTFGFSEGATIRGVDAVLSSGQGTQEIPSGMRVRVVASGTTIPVFVPGVIGRHQLMAPLAAIAVAGGLGINAVDAAAALTSFHAPAGRMSLIRGVKQTVILDDTYNSSPAALTAALTTLAEFPDAKRKIACLGTMAELGALSESAHKEAGEQVAALGIKLLITVGVEGKRIADAAQKSSMHAHDIQSFDASSDAGRYLQEQLQPGDVVLVKGSQMVRMEKIVKEVMAEPERATELLVRQGPEWQNR